MHRKNTSPTLLKDIISDLLTGGALPFNPDDARIWKVWDEVVGPAIARNAQPLRIKNRQLRVRVSDPIWFQELQFMAEDIRDKLNDRLSRKAIDRIEFSVGPKVTV